MKISFLTLLAVACSGSLSAQAADNRIHTHAKFTFDRQVLRPGSAWPQLYLEANHPGRGILLSAGKQLNSFSEIEIGKSFCHLGISLPPSETFIKPEHQDLRVIQSLNNNGNQSLELETAAGPHVAIACFQKQAATQVAALAPSYNVIAAALGALGYPGSDGFAAEGLPAGPTVEVAALIEAPAANSSTAATPEDCFE